MFWGLVLEPSKRYTQKVQESFHISQASLELSTCNLSPIEVIIEYDGANYVLATLSKSANIYQVPLDLNFNAGDQISFRTIGKGRVHLTGYHLLQDDVDDFMMNGEEESDIEEEETDNSLLTKQQAKRKKPDSTKSPSKKKKLSHTNEAEASDDDDSDDDTFGADDDLDMEDSLEDEENDKDAELEEEEDEEEDEDEEMEEEEEDEDDEDDEDDEEKEVSKKAKPASSKSKADVSMNGKSMKNKAMEAAKGTPKSAKKSPGKELKENKTQKQTDKKSPKKEQNENQESSPQKKVLEGGVIIEELRMGYGPVAKQGKMVQVYYVGCLQSTKKQFDATTHGPGFKFRLGRGEVIKGWDIGVNGMKVGGKRRITIPAQLAYGVRGSPPAIPPNATLVFEVELKGVN